MKRKSSKQKLLLKSAENLFAKYGYRKVSIDEIVWEAGVAKGTFYLYFKNKDDLYSQIIDNYYQQEIKEPVKEYAAKEKKIRMRLYVDFIYAIFYFRQRKILQEIILQNSNYFSESVNFNAILKKNVEMMKILFAENIEEIRSDMNLEKLAEIYALQLTLVYREKDEKKIWQRAEDLARIFVDGILSCHKWQEIKAEEIINEVKNNYLW